MQSSSKSKFFPNKFFPSSGPPTKTPTRFYVRVATVFFLLLFASHETKAEAFSINDAISQAVHTNPAVGEAAANRRVTDTDLYQTQGAYLPQVRLESRIGPEKFNQVINPQPLGNGSWLNGREASVVVRQILFNGFASIHETWRQAARVNAAAFRVRERIELTALDAAEAYIDVVRHLRLVTLANQKLIKPGCVVIGTFPAWEPAGSLPRGPSPASNTCVVAPPCAGMLTTGVPEPAKAGVGTLNICWAGAGPLKPAKELPKSAPSCAPPGSPRDTSP